jgi:hypothetical protein
MSKEKGCKFVPNDASFSLLVLNFFLGCDLVYALVGCDQKAVKPSEMKLYTFIGGRAHVCCISTIVFKASVRRRLGDA